MLLKPIFDRKLLRVNQKRYKALRAKTNFLELTSATKICDDLTIYNKLYNKILELNYNQDYIYNFLKEQNSFQCYFRNNCNLIFDEEMIPFNNNSFDLVISNLAMHFINQIPAFLIQIKNILEDEGRVIFSFFGEDNLELLAKSILQAEDELYNAISPRTIPTIDIKTSAQLFVKAGFKNVIADIENIDCQFDSFYDFLYFLKVNSYGNIMLNRSKTFFTKKLLDKTAKIYQKLTNNNQSKITTTFKIITVIAQK